MGGDGAREPPVPDGDAAALVAAAQRLWPDPGRARLTRRRTAPTGRDREFLLLPSARRPRLLLPAGERRAAAAVARRTSSLTSTPERALRALVAAAARTGLVERLVADRLHVDVAPATESVEAVLADVVGEPVVVSLGVGTARANRKPILQAVTPSGRTVAWVKVGDTDAARRLVDGEAAALATLAAVPFEHLRVPAVLHHGDWNGLRLLVLSPVGDGSRRRRGRDELPAAAMGELARAGGAGGAGDRARFWARVRATVDAAGPGAQRLAALLDAAEDRWGTAAVATGWSHGDWTPWNMAWVGTTAHVWDWERFSTASPVGLDALHHRMQSHARRSGDWDAALAVLDADAPALLAAVGSADDPATVVSLYLLDLCCRYVEASAGPLGMHLRGRAEWLLDVVERRVRP